MRHADGSWCWLEVFVIPSGPGTQRWIFGARNIDAERRQRDRIVQAQRLESAGVVASGIAHDFNNLLTVTLGFSEMLPASQARDEIIKATTEAAQLTRQLLSFARTNRFGPSAVNASELLLDIEPMLISLLGPTIVTKIELPDSPVTAAISAGQLHQVVLNLCTNAKEAMVDGGSLAISLRSLRLATDAQLPAGSYAEIEIEDDGPGMDEFTRQRAFEPFFSTKDADRGSGLGLASVYGIVTNVGGSVTLTSEPGRGTTIRLLLPTATVSQQQPVVQLVEPRPARQGHAQTVLVVEDDLSVRSLVVHVLEDAGFVVESVQSGSEALSLLRTLEPDLIVSDVVMAGMQGIELSQRVRERFPGMRFLFMSGNSDAQSKDWESERASLFIAKPFRSTDLVAQVRVLLNTVVADT